MFKTHCPACLKELENFFVCDACGAVQEPKEMGPFDLLGMTTEVPVNQMELQSHYFRCQRLIHPDAFVGQSADQQAKAHAWSEQINAAYQTLKDPLKTVAYILGSQGYDLSRTTFDPGILLEALTLQE